MTMATMSILGLYEFDETLFDELKIPNGVDKELLVDNLLCECAELEVLYAEPNFMKMMIGKWSAKELPTWEKLNELFNLEYNPLYNVDAYETLTEQRDLAYTHDSTDRHDMTDTHDMAHTIDSTEVDSTSGFNSNEFQNHDKTKIDSTNNDAGTINTAGTITTDGTDTDKGTITTTNRRYGNIGVTMSQDMARKEMDVRPEMNMMNYIIKSFKNRFCLLVY